MSPRPWAFRFRDDPERAPKIVYQQLVVSRQDVAPSDDHDVRSDIAALDTSLLTHRPKAPFDPVPFGGVPDSLRHRQSDAQTPARVSQTALHRHPLRMKAAARGRRDEVRSFRQPPDRTCARLAHRAAQNAPLRRQALAAVSAASGDDLAAALGRHARTETMAALANELARLIRPLHGSSPVE
jgi:hypothetical protein